MKNKITLLTASALCLFASTSFGQVARNCFMEDFGSSTCPPCAAFNSWFDPWEDNKGANDQGTQLVVVKWQMNWPNPGNDASYNQDGYSRRVYYQVTGVPSLFVNGTKTSASSSSIDNIFTSCSGGTANTSDLDIQGEYIVDGSEPNGTATWSYSITPSADVTGNYTVYAALTNSHYQNSANTTGQLNYTHVMRKMVPNTSGKAVAGFTNGTAVSDQGTYSYTVGNVTQNSFNFWNNPYNGHLIIWVQNNTTKEVIQSKAIPATWATNVASVNNINHVSVFPNPATDQAHVLFNAVKATDVTVTVYDAIGRQVYSQAPQTVQSGKQHIVIPTSNLANGTYSVNIQSADGVKSTRLSVAR